MQLTLGEAGGLDRGAAGGHQRGQLTAWPVGLELRQVDPAQGLTGGACRVQRVGLRPVAPRRPHRTVQLDDLLPGGAQVPGEASAVTTGTLQRPRPRTVPGPDLEELLVATGVGVHRQLGKHTAGGRVHDRGGVGVLVGVDPDDDIDHVGKTGHRVHLLGPGNVGSGPVGDGRTVTGHARSHGRSSS